MPYHFINNNIDYIKVNGIKRTGQIHHFKTLSSTMDKARELARNGAPNLSVVLAEEQTKGRGRLNRIWLSNKGGLWFTIILRPDLPLHLVFQVNFAASLSLARTLKYKYKLDVSVKWPNDILLKDKTSAKYKKLAGLLSEMETEGDSLSFVNIGIGINVNNNPESYQPYAISIKNVLGNDSVQDICIMDLLYSFLDHFEKQLMNIMDIDVQPRLISLHDSKLVSHTEPINNRYIKTNHKLMEQWKQMTSTIGKHVRIETFDDVYEGVAVDIDQSGALIIRDNDGTEKKIIYGDCFYHDTY